MQTNAMENINIKNGFENYVLLGLFEIMFYQISIQRITIFDNYQESWWISNPQTYSLSEFSVEGAAGANMVRFPGLYSNMKTESDVCTIN